MRLNLGFPPRAAELGLLSGQSVRPDSLESGMGPADLLHLQDRVERQHCSPALLDYVLDLLACSREPGRQGYPLSPRAGLGLLAAAKAWALLLGRDHVVPDDIQAVFPAVCEHRLDGGHARGGQGELSRALLEAVDGLR
jgi:MoxR-like ATPase